MKYQNKRASFSCMEEGTISDFKIIQSHEAAFAKGYTDRVLSHLKLLDVENDGYPVNRYTHSLQSATMAKQAGKDDEYIVCALLHDIGDYLSLDNHADIAAGILKPFVAEKNHWMLQKHAIFQGYHFWDKIGLNRNTRERYRGHPYFEHTAEFCEKFDQTAFNRNIEIYPIEAFEPLVRKVFEKPIDASYSS